MANELSTQQTELVNAMQQQGLGNLIKPLTREIELFDTFVAGTTHLEDPEVLSQIQENDKLKLMREDNKFDGKAILVLTEAGEKLGYVPEKDNVVFSRLMDAGKLLCARISEISKRGDYTHIKIKIYLVDF